ncbi:MAG: histidine phosphatase family protein [Panacagrimonas sp.]
MQLLLLRHPPVALAAGICYGSSDVAAQSLSATDLARLRAQIPEQAVIWTSPARRCQQLAAQLARGSSRPNIDARLREMDFGQWEMRRFDDIDRDLIDAWAEDPWGFVPPGGESAEAMHSRVLQFLHDLRQRHRQGPTLIIAHAGSLRVIRGHLAGLPRSQWLNLECEPAGLFRLDCA